MSGDASQQHPGQMAPGGSAGVHIAGRREIVLKGCDRRVEVAGFEGRFGPAGAGCAVANSKECETDIAQPAAMRLLAAAASPTSA